MKTTTPTPAHHLRHALIEPLEARIAPATFAVTSIIDSGAGTLRDAILAANASPGPDIIAFNLGSPGVKTIALQSALPAITDTVKIDGWTHEGFSGTPLIVLDGSDAGINAGALTFESHDGSKLRGMVIHSFDGNGVRLYDVDHMAIKGCYIGTDATGTVKLANGGAGIQLSGNSDANSIGGKSVKARNVISGNGKSGIEISDSDGNRIRGNFLGVDATGTADLGNLGNGITVQIGSDRNTIGGSTQGEGNVISGNSVYGIMISDADKNLIAGNLIGTDATGSQPIGNGLYGVELKTSALQNIVGGDTPGARNVISGNHFGGVRLEISATANIISGNFIGTDISGKFGSVGNGGDGITIQTASQGNVIGGDTPARRNVIAGNEGNGVRIDGSAGNSLRGNYIGVPKDGSSFLPNDLDGVRIENGSVGNFIGGSLPGQRNIISGNAHDGISVSGQGTIANHITGNYIGAGKTGLVTNGNGFSGINIFGHADQTDIGGSLRGSGNVIAGNGQHGIRLGAVADVIVQGNRIGIAAIGKTALGNHLSGIFVNAEATDITIGAIAGEIAGGNRIANNGDAGIATLGAASIRNVRISSNAIFNNGGLGIDLGDDGATANDSGDADTGANGLQNAPILQDLALSPNGVSISGTINTSPGQTVRIEFFVNQAGGSLEPREGKRFLGATDVLMSGTSATFGAAYAGVKLGSVVTAVAIDAQGNTSEFSPGFLVALPPA